MNKEIAYLVQTPAYIPNYVKMLEAAGGDVYILSWKKPVEYKNSIFFPDSTWSSGRNKLAEIVPKKYLYYVMIDDDVELFVREKKYPEDVDKNPWKIFGDFLIKYEPAIGTVYCSNELTEAKFKHYLDDDKEINTLKEHEPILSAIHKDVLDLCFPLFLGFDRFSMVWPACCYILTTKIAFASNSILQCNKLILKNNLHRPEYGVFPKVTLFWFFGSSIINKKDKDEVYLEFVYKKDPIPGEYKKPYPGKYKNLMEEFKNKVKKDHILWKDHPFINE